jgi:hypothetical protein
MEKLTFLSERKRQNMNRNARRRILAHAKMILDERYNTSDCTGDQLLLFDDMRTMALGLIDGTRSEISDYEMYVNCVKQFLSLADKDK